MNIFITICLFILGLVFGSFFFVVASRLPINEDITKTHSHCENCKATLKWYELIPVFSYIFLRGKCHHCHTKISILYPLIELSTGILFAVSYLLYNFDYQFFISIALSSLLILIFISDFKYFIILDSPLVISIIIILGTYLYFFDIKYVLLHILYGLFIFIFLLFIKFLGDKLFKRESLGGGDIKLGFVIGLTLGIPLGCVALVLSAFLALPYALTSLYLNEERELPFGPFMIAATVIVFIYMVKFNYLIDFLTF